MAQKSCSTRTDRGSSPRWKPQRNPTAMKTVIGWFLTHREHVAFAVELTTRCVVEHLLLAARVGIGGGLAVRFVVEWLIQRLKR